MEAPLGYVHVPGNHHLYVPDTVRQGRFEEHFGDTFATDLPEHLVDGEPWPLVRLVGDEVAVVAVNSSRPNPLPWRSSGKIPSAQLDALPRVLADERVRDRFVFLITHYAPRLRDGQPDTRRHGLVNADAFLEACRDLTPGAILFGHVHWRYTVRIEGVTPRLFCAGSATKRDVEGLWVFDVEAGSARATPGRWDGERFVLEADEALDVLA